MSMNIKLGWDHIMYVAKVCYQVMCVAPFPQLCFSCRLGADFRLSQLRRLSTRVFVYCALTSSWLSCVLHVLLRVQCTILPFLMFYDREAARRSLLDARLINN